MRPLLSKRLSLRWLKADDDAFILTLLNSPGWLEFIGDKNVHSLAAARTYIKNGPPSIPGQPPLRRYAIRLHGSEQAMGLCGLVNREGLSGPDLGFALLPQFAGRGYAREAAELVLAHERAARAIGRVLAITSPNNLGSQKLLLALGFVRLADVQVSPDAPAIHCYAQDA